MPKIAICDDEQPIREYLKSLTEKCIPDSQVRLFGSGEALLRDQTSFDVILLDVSLRGEPWHRRHGTGRAPRDRISVRRQCRHMVLSVIVS